MTSLLAKDWVREAMTVLAIGIVVAIIGPFGSFHEMALPWRALYWLTIVVVAWAQWAAFDRLIDWLGANAFEAPPWPWWLQGLAISVINAALLTAEILVLRQALELHGQIGFADLFPWVVGLSLMVYGLVSGLILWARHAADAAVERAGAPPHATPEERFLRRLPPDKRAALQCLKTEDHYLRVYTAAGDAMILLRLKDALRELDGCDGAQVHRSFWVARTAVREAYRSGRKWRLRLGNGLDVPVSERFVPHLRAAGWLG